MVTLKEIREFMRKMPTASFKDANAYLMRTNGNVVAAISLFSKERK